MFRGRTDEKNKKKNKKIDTGWGVKQHFKKIFLGGLKFFAKKIFFSYFSYFSRQSNLRAKSRFNKYGVVQEILPLKDMVTFRLKILGS